MPISPLKPPAVAATARALAARVPYPVWALVILAAFAAFFPFISDDYGMHGDSVIQRGIASANLRYIMGEENALPNNQNRYYGIAFELPVLLAERALGLTDDRAVYIFRRAATHLLFLFGAFACFILARRLFNSLPIALLAMLLFLLHPRLYAHSIFNGKDSPFLAMFMITLLGAHWAFGRNSVWAFALLGVLAALAANVRIAGVVLIAAVLGLRLIDLFCADGWGGPNGRGRVLTTGAAFAAAAAWAFFVSTPHLWSDPLALMDAAEIFSSHPHWVSELFQGEYVHSHTIPPRYIPVWIWITTPPLTLLFAALGAALVLRRAAVNPKDALRNGDVRFGLLLIALFALPIIGAAYIGVNMYNGWRHMHFLYAPLVLLAAFALHWLPREFKPGTLRRSFARWGALALICAGLAASLTAIFQLHPRQHDYFNFFVDRETPERLRKQYVMDYYQVNKIDGFRRLLELHPSGHIFLNLHQYKRIEVAALILPAAERRRFVMDADPDADPYGSYRIVTNYNNFALPLYGGMDEIHSVKTYGSSVMRVYGDTAKHQARADAHAARLRELRAALASTQPIARSHWDIHLSPDENSIVYLKEPCADEDIAGEFFLRVAPESVEDLPKDQKRHGYENLDFDLLLPRMGADASESGAEFISTIEEICVASVRLPDYPIAQIYTGHLDVSGKTWGVTLAAPRQRQRPALPGEGQSPPLEPAVRSRYDVYFNPDENSVAYLKDPCADEDIADRFFLHIVPEDVDDLPDARKPHGFDSGDFSLLNPDLKPGGDNVEFASVHEERCLASVRLPDYPIAEIHTGQFNADGRIWSEGIDLAAFKRAASE